METSKKTAKARKKLPKGARFLIRLDDLERERRIFIPGHRFEPFRPAYVNPNSLVLLSTNAILLAEKVISLSLEDFGRFHSLLDSSLVLSILEESWPGNMKVMANTLNGSNTALVRLKARNLDSLFKKNTGIKAGTYLRCTVQVISPMVITMEALDAEDPCLGGREAWFDSLDAAFSIAMEELRQPSDNTGLLSLAYRYGGKAVYGNPAASITDYLEADRLVSLMDFGGNGILWKRGARAEELSFPDIPDRYGEGSRKPVNKRGGNISKGSKRIKTSVRSSVYTRMNEFFDAYEFAFNSEEIISLLIDMVYRQRNLQEVWDQFFENASQWTVFPEASDEMAGLLRAFCDEALGEYAPGDDDYGEFRATLVDMYADHVAWIRKLDSWKLRPEDLPREEFTELSRLIGELNHVLVTLNPSPYQEVQSPEEIRAFHSTLANLNPIFQDLKRRVEAGIKKRRRI